MPSVKVNLKRLMRLAAFLCLVAAFCVAEHWLKLGNRGEWAAAGLALYVLADVA